MFDFSWSELLVLLIVTLVFVGPKDLPKVLVMAGKWTRKMRGMAYDLQRALEEMARESELDELRKQAGSIDPRRVLESHLDPGGVLRDALTGSAPHDASAPLALPGAASAPAAAAPEVAPPEHEPEKPAP